MKSVVGSLAFAVAQAHYGSYNYKYQNTGDSTYNPWSGVDGVATNPAIPADKLTWYSPEMQYSPPRIPYAPSQSKDTQYAVCNISVPGQEVSIGITAPAATWGIQLAQSPGKAIAMKLNASDVPVATYKLTVGTYGIEVSDCSKNLPEFWPLEEMDRYGVSNKYQDPTRGKFPEVVIAASSVVDEITTNILLNLSGEDSLMGRTLILTDTTDPDTLLGCCFIGEDKPPGAPAPVDTYPYQRQGYPYNHAPQYGRYDLDHHDADDIEHDDENDFMGYGSSRMPGRSRFSMMSRMRGGPSYGGGYSGMQYSQAPTHNHMHRHYAPRY
jgi:hypothetical protein